MRGGRRNAWVFRAGTLLLTVALLGGLFAWRFDRWVGSLRFYETAHDADFANQEFPLLSEHQVVQLGAAHTLDDHPRSSYLEHSEKKRPGTIRIGVFGCSFVKGEEAAPGNDVPSLLEQALYEAGVCHVEVLNFGVSGYGFHQAFLLWECLHERFELDYTVFYLFGFHSQRDSTFVMLDDIYAPVHARHVLEDGRLRLVEVLGGNRLEACERYFGPVPAWRYLRFDRKAPPCLRALLPSGRRLGNPFYYRRDPAAEAEELNRLLVDELHRRAANLLVLCDRGAPLKTLRDLPRARRFVAESAALRFALGREDVYMAPRGHLSALGNQVVSRELLALLTGSRQLTVPSIAYMGGRDRGSFERIEPLHLYGHVSISANGDPLGVLVAAGGAPPWPVASLRSPKVSSLIDVSDRKQLAFVPVLQPLSGREPVRITFMAALGTVRFPIGRVVADTPVLGWMKRRVRPAHKASTEWTVDWEPQESPLELRLDGPSTPRDVQLWIGDTPILHGVPSADADGGERPNVFHLEPIGSPLLSLRGDPEQSLQAVQLPGSGLIELHLEREDGAKVRVPIRGFRLTNVRLHSLTTSIDHPIALPGP